MRTKQAATAFDWGRSRTTESAPAEKPRKFPIGTVSKSHIQTLPQLAEEVRLAGGQPLSFVDSKGKLICRIFAASSQIEGAAMEVPLNRMLENTAYLLGRVGDQGVVRIVRKGPVARAIGDENWLTVAYFAGRNFELKKA